MTGLRNHPWLAACDLAALLLALVLPANASGRAPSGGGVTPPSTGTSGFFTENRGQWDARVRFRADQGGAVLWFRDDVITSQFIHRVPRGNESPDDPHSLALGVPGDLSSEAGLLARGSSIKMVVVHADFVANKFAYSARLVAAHRSRVRHGGGWVHCDSLVCSPPVNRQHRMVFNSGGLNALS